MRRRRREFLPGVFMPAWSGGVAPLTFLLNDEFTTNRAAGAVDGTSAEPGGTGGAPLNTRAAVDTSGTGVIITGSKLSITGNGTANNQLACHGAMPKTPGTVLAWNFTHPGGGASIATRSHGIRSAQSGEADQQGIFWSAGNLRVITTAAGGQNTIGTTNVTDSLTYTCYIALRTAGALMFVKGDVYTEIEMLGFNVRTHSANMYPGWSITNNTYTILIDNVKIPDEAWLPAPLVSDGFGGTWGTTDGSGHPDPTVGVGGSGVTWTDRLGVWGSAAGVASCGTLDGGGSGIATAPAGVVNVHCVAKLTRSGDNVGIIVRYADANNYVYAFHDGTNATLRKVVAGVDSEVIAPTAATYGAGRELWIYARGTTFRLFYYGTLIGSAATISDAGLQTGTACGMYTTNTGNTFDDFHVYACGTEGQYSALSNFLA